MQHHGYQHTVTETQQSNVLTVVLTNVTPINNKRGNVSVTLTPGHLQSMTTRTHPLVTNRRID